MILEKCEIHLKTHLDYLCLDTECTNNTRCCILCIKNKHRKCSKESIILVSGEYSKNLSQKNRSFENKIREKLENFNKKLLQTFEKCFDEFLEKMFLSGGTQRVSVKSILNNKYLQFFEIIKTKDHIKIMNSFMSDDLFNENVTQFECLIQRNIDKIVTNFAQTNLNDKDTPCLKNFMYHENLKVEIKNQRVIVECKNSGKDDYSMFVIKNPIRNKIKLKYRISNLLLDDRYLEFGIMNDTDFKSIEQNLIGDLLFGSYCYSGYSSKGFNKEPPTSEMSSSLGFCDGDEIEVLVDKLNHKLTFSINNKIENTADIEESEQDLYVYFILYFNKQRLEIESMEYT